MPSPTEADTALATGGGGTEAAAPEGDSVLTIVARPGSGALKPNAQHINNAVNLRAALYMFGGIAGIIGVLLYLLQVGTTKPQGPATLTPFVAVEVTNTPHVVIPGVSVPTQSVAVVPPEVVVVVTVVMPTIASTLPPTATGTPEPSPTLTPTLTLTPTWTLTPTPTFRVDAVVGLKVYYEPTWAVESRTVGGLWPEQVKGFGAACPVDIPLGAWLTTRAGRRFVCVDRGRNLRCLDGLCTIVVYTDELIAGLEDVQIEARPLNVGGQ